jgi:hypothetical protein
MDQPPLVAHQCACSSTQHQVTRGGCPFPFMGIAESFVEAQHEL